MKMICRQLTNDQNQISLFDEAIINIASNADIMMICPYIKLNYLERIIKKSNSWKLITDFVAWIYSQWKSNSEIRDFVLKNSKKIRHYPGVHAKAIISGNKAIVGSANFTESGIKENIELGVLIEETAPIVELKDWFTQLWNLGEKLDERNTKDCIQKIGKPPQQHKPPAPEIIKVPNRLNKTSLVDLTPHLTNSNSLTYPPGLIETLKSTKDRKWLEDCFDFLSEMLTHFDLKSSDKRLVTTFTKSCRLPVTIGQRYAATLFYDPSKSRKEKNNCAIHLIMPLDYDCKVNREKHRILFNDIFTNNKEDAGQWITFDRKGDFDISSDLKKDWYQAISVELKRCRRGSGFRRHHEPMIFDLITDLSYRKKILDTAFGPY